MHRLMSIDDALEVFMNYSFHGGELTFAKPKEFLSFEPSEKSKQYLRSLNYLSLHLPFRHKFGDDEVTKKIVEKALYIKNDLGISNFVLHHHQIQEPRYVQTIPSLCFENMDKKKGFSVNYYKEAVNDYAAGFVLDTTHALTWSRAHLEELYNALNNDIRQLHYSEYKDNMTHAPVYHDTNNLSSFVKKFDVPLILETNYEGIDSFEKDMDFLGLK